MDGQRAEPLNIVTARELVDDPPPSRPIAIQGVMRVRDLVIVTAPWDSFKSTFTLELAWSLATGAPFLGYYDVVNKQRMLIVQSEIDPGAYAERVVRFGRSDDLYIASDFYFDLDQLDRLYVTLEDYDLDGVVLDPLGVMWPAYSRSGEAFNENVKTHVSPLLKELKAWDKTVVLVHHDPKPSAGMRNRAAGASALLNDPDVRVLIDRVEHKKKDDDDDFPGLPRIEVEIRNRLQAGQSFQAAFVKGRLRAGAGLRNIS